MILEKNQFTYFDDEDVGKDISMFSSHRMDYVYYRIECGRWRRADSCFLPDEQCATLSQKDEFMKLPNHISTHVDLFAFINNLFGCDVLSNDFKKDISRAINPSKITKLYVACDSDMSSLDGGREFVCRKYDFVNQEVTEQRATSPYQYGYSKKAEEKKGAFLSDTIYSDYNTYEVMDLFPNARKKDTWIVISFAGADEVAKMLKKGTYIDFIETSLSSKKKKKAFCEEHGFIWIDAMFGVSLIHDMIVIGDKYPEVLKASTAPDIRGWSELMHYYRKLPAERRPIFVRESVFQEVLSTINI